jgi:uncharacterized protein YbjT (DUF2867 family)
MHEPNGSIDGSQVLNLLIANAPAEEQLRVIVRDPGRPSASVRDRVDVVTGSHEDAAVVGRAFEGADAVFWIVPPDSQAPSLEVAYSGFTRAAAATLRANRVGHVVAVSALGRGTAAVDHAGLVTASLEMDDLIARTGVAYRALANASFMDNLLDDAESIRERGVFTDTTTADRKAPVVATRDIAAAAAGLLLHRSWSGADSVALLGPDELSPNDLARIMSEVLGIPVRYERETFEQFGGTLRTYGLGDAFVQGLVDMKRAKDEGLDDGVDRATAASTPTTFRTWCEDVLKPAIAA